jgi:hypothetical protein
MTSKASRSAKTSSKKPSKDPASLPKTGNIDGIRRVLAERGSTDKDREYLVDWKPTWEPMLNIEASSATVLQEWDDTKKMERTFPFENKTVMRCTNASADDSPEHILLMKKTVFDHFRSKVLQDKAGVTAHELFQDNEWVFRSDKHRQRAERIARNLGKDIPSAAEVIRRTYTVLRGRPKSSRYDDGTQDEDLPYRAIKVKYIGRIDQNIITDQAKRPASSVVSFLVPLFNASLQQLKNSTWTYKSASNIARPLSETVAMFPTHAPYLLKDPMLLMFTRLFLMGDEIAESLTTVGIEVGDKWHEHTRDQFLWTYCGDWEKRPIDCVERTYIATRDEVRWFARNKVDQDGFVISRDEEEDGSDGEGDGEYDDSQDGQAEYY